MEENHYSPDFLSLSWLWTEEALYTVRVLAATQNSPHHSPFYHYWTKLWCWWYRMGGSGPLASASPSYESMSLSWLVSSFLLGQQHEGSRLDKWSRRAGPSACFSWEEDVKTPLNPQRCFSPLHSVLHRGTRLARDWSMDQMFQWAFLPAAIKLFTCSPICKGEATIIIIIYVLFMLSLSIALHSTPTITLDLCWCFFSLWDSDSEEKPSHCDILYYYILL